MKKFIIWLCLCLLLAIAGKTAGFTYDSFIAGMIASITLWIPALILDAMIGGRSKMNLSDTSGMMVSKDYRERFRAEYIQLKIRITGLSTMLEKYKEGTLSFEPSCSYTLLHAQLKSMEAYKALLEERAVIENIGLN